MPRGSNRRGARGAGLVWALAAACAGAQAEGRPGGPTVARFEPLGQGVAWEQLQPEEPALPIWARILARSLPRTAALQLALDAEHRIRNPLGPALSARLRWEVADALRCDYAMEIAAFDLARAGLDAEAARAEGLPDAERSALEFARDLTLSASAIPDEQVAALIEAFGPDDVVAIVHTVAHANFQDRIYLALGLVAEPGGPLPPSELLPARAGEPTPRREARGEAGRGVSAGERPAWSAHGAHELRAALEAQQARVSRIPEPDAVRLARLPRPERERVAGSNWGRVSMGYQPDLTRAWFQAMRAFDQEARLDPVFATTLFWVVTRTNECFY
jgi:hypothetical protein